MEKRFKSVICVDLLIKKDNKILLMERANTGYEDGKYELPGGHLDPNEDIFHAMVREAKEELLIDINENDLKIIHLLHHYNGERLNIIFELNGNNIKPKIGEPNKCSNLKWVKIDELPNNTIDKVRIIINNIINNKFYDKL